MRVAILDLDGTLVTTAEVHKLAWELAMKDLNLRSAIDLDSLMGRKTEEIAKILAKDNWKELFDKKNYYFDILVVRLASPTPCAKDFLKKLKDKGIKIAVVTSSLKRSALKSLSILNFNPDVLIAGDDVNLGKPNPEPIRKALEILNAKPEEAFGVGDTLQDIIAYKACGLKEMFILESDLKIDFTKALELGAKKVKNLCELMVYV